MAVSDTEMSETKRPVIRFNENFNSAKPIDITKTVIAKQNKIGTPPEMSNSKLMASYSRLAASPVYGIGSGA